MRRDTTSKTTVVDRGQAGGVATVPRFLRGAWRSGLDRCSGPWDGTRAEGSERGIRRWRDRLSAKWPHGRSSERRKAPVDSSQESG